MAKNTPEKLEDVRIEVLPDGRFRVVGHRHYGTYKSMVLAQRRATQVLVSGKGVK